MRRFTRVSAVVLGIVGVLVCIAAIAAGWVLAARIVDRVARFAARLDAGLSEADGRLAGMEERRQAMHSNLSEVQGAVERIAAENPELPQVRAALEEHAARLRPALDRADALASSLQASAALLESIAGVVAEFADDPEASNRLQAASTTLGEAAESLQVLRTRAEDLRSATGVRLVRELASMAREAVAGSERLGVGLAAARRELSAARGHVATLSDRIAFWVYVAAMANTCAWLWGAVGQTCLINWGRGRVCPCGKG